MIITTESLGNLQVQLYEMSHLTFNGVSMFANHNESGEEAVFNDMAQDSNPAQDNTMSIYVSSDGSAGPKVSINKALLLAALTMQADDLKHQTMMGRSMHQQQIQQMEQTAIANSQTKTAKGYK